MQRPLEGETEVLVNRVLYDRLYISIPCPPSPFPRSLNYSSQLRRWWEGTEVVRALCPRTLRNREGRGKGGTRVLQWALIVMFHLLSCTYLVHPRSVNMQRPSLRTPVTSIYPYHSAAREAHNLHVQMELIGGRGQIFPFFSNVLMPNTFQRLINNL